MNRAWLARRTKQGLAARQYASLSRQLRRATNAGAPLPITLVSRGVGCTLTLTVGKVQDEVREYAMDEEW